MKALSDAIAIMKSADHADFIVMRGLCHDGTGKTAGWAGVLL